MNLKGFSSFFSLSKWKLTLTKFGTILCYLRLIRLRPISIEGGSLLSLGVITLILPKIVCKWSNFMPMMAAANFKEKKMSALVLKVSIISLIFYSLYLGSSKISTLTILLWSYPTTLPFAPQSSFDQWVTSTFSPTWNSSWISLKRWMVLVVL